VVAADQLLCELQSVAVEWKSLRQATNCSCAMPFEHHTKKVRLSSLLSLTFFLLFVIVISFLLSFLISGFGLFHSLAVSGFLRATAVPACTAESAY